MICLVSFVCFVAFALVGFIFVSFGRCLICLTTSCFVLWCDFGCLFDFFVCLLVGGCFECCVAFAFSWLWLGIYFVCFGLDYCWWFIYLFWDTALTLYFGLIWFWFDCYLLLLCANSRLIIYTLMWPLLLLLYLLNWFDTLFGFAGACFAWCLVVLYSCLLVCVFTCCLRWFCVFCLLKLKVGVLVCGITFELFCWFCTLGFVGWLFAC